MSTKALSKTISSPSVFDDFFKPWNEWFGNGGLSPRITNVPAVNVTENAKEYNVSLAAPGLKKDDFRIDIEGNMLTVSSEKDESKEEKEEKYTRKEYSYSSFSRSFTLPDDVRQEAVDASYKDGLLIIRLPRKEEARQTASSKRIAVK
jgi:HSP20 family protein